MNLTQNIEAIIDSHSHKDDVINIVTWTIEDWTKNRENTIQNLNFEGKISFELSDQRELRFSNCNLGELIFSADLISESYNPKVIFVNCNINSIWFRGYPKIDSSIPITSNRKLGKKYSADNYGFDLIEFIQLKSKSVILDKEVHAKSIALKMSKVSFLKIRCHFSICYFENRPTSLEKVYEYEKVLIEINDEKNKNVRLGFDRTNIRILFLYGNINTALNLRKAYFQSLHLNHFKFRSLGLPDPVITGSEIIFTSSELCFGDLNLKDIFLNYKVGFSKGMKLSEHPDESLEWPLKLYHDHKDNQFAYNELKEIMARRKDYELESFYHSQEMESYYMASKSGYKSLTQWIDFTFKVWLPFKASRFGQSLARPTLLLLTFHTLLVFVMIAVSGDTLNLEWTGQFSWPSFMKGINVYFYTILPTHRLSYGTGEMMNPTISFLMRLCSSILIYHIILASRKHLQPK